METAGVRFSTRQMPFLSPNQQCQSTVTNKKLTQISLSAITETKHLPVTVACNWQIYTVNNVRKGYYLLFQTVF